MMEATFHAVHGSLSMAGSALAAVAWGAGAEKERGEGPRAMLGRLRAVRGLAPSRTIVSGG